MEDELTAVLEEGETLLEGIVELLAELVELGDEARIGGVEGKGGFVLGPGAGGVTGGVPGGQISRYPDGGL